MSLAGLVTLRGSLAVVRRATRSVNTDLSVNSAWATVNAALPIDLDVVSRKLVEEGWGLEVSGDLLGTVVPGTDIKEQDGLQVSSGLYAGRSLRVVGIREYQDSLGTDHITVLLQYVPSETFA